MCTDMSSDEQDLATKKWREAEEPGTASSKDPGEAHENSCVLSEEDADIQNRMKEYMMKSLKWSHKELHDALVIAGMSAPKTPSMVNYLAALQHQFGDDKFGFLPQNWQGHSKHRIQEVLRCLRRTGLKLGGKLGDKKNVLAERLAHWLNKVLGAGRNVPSQIAEEGDEDASDVEGDAEAKPRNYKIILVENAGGAADVPPGASATAEQAESALGHVQATDLDADIFESLDEDQKEEEMALIGRIVKPPLSTYDSIAWSLVSNR